MIWQDAVVGAWRYLESIGAKPTARKAMEIARLGGAKFRSVEAQKLLAKFSDASRMQSGCTPDAQNTHAGCTPDAPGMQSGCIFTGANKVSLVPKPISPPEPNGSSPPPAKPKAVRLVEEHPAVDFEPEDEVRVSALLLQHAPSGRIAPSTLARLRCQFRAKLDAVGAACWRYGVDTALAKPAGWPYAVSVMARNPTGPPAAAPRARSRGAPVPECLQPSDEKMALYERIGKQHALRTGTDPLGRLEDVALARKP